MINYNEYIIYPLDFRLTCKSVQHARVPTQCATSESFPTFTNQRGLSEDEVPHLGNAYAIFPDQRIQHVNNMTSFFGDRIKTGSALMEEMK